MTLADLALSRGTLDRASTRRLDEQWLQAAWADPATPVLPVSAGQALARQANGRAELLFLSPAETPDGNRYLLAVDAGTTFFAVGLEQLPTVDDIGAAPVGLREIAGLLGDRDVALLVHAIALDNWHRTHTHCPRCGHPTVVETAGHTRRCPADRSEHFPRTDPAVIMAVVDDDDRILLGRQDAWPPRRFSTLAGFVEPGESLEQAVAREVHEETGVTVRRAVYMGSQPWPFPSSLMAGFVAEAATTDLAVDTVEIAEALWLSRGDLQQAMSAEEVLLPPRVSIARRLIEHWYGEPLPDDGIWR